MPLVGTESVQSAPPKGIESMQDAPPRGTESMQSASPYNNKSQQILYLEEILTREPREEWEGFNSQIKAWQNQQSYPKFETVYGKKLERNSKILKDLLRAKWSKEIKENLVLKELQISKLLKWQIKSKKYY